VPEGGAEAEFSKNFKQWEDTRNHKVAGKTSGSESGTTKNAPASTGNNNGGASGANRYGRQGTGSEGQTYTNNDFIKDMMNQRMQLPAGHQSQGSLQLSNRQPLPSLKASLQSPLHQSKDSQK
jgi:hypothetical protein